MQFKVYEIPGKKIGCTDRWPKRIKEQGYKETECGVLFETDDIIIASLLEKTLQQVYDYEVDKMFYVDTYKIHHGRVVGEETRAKQSVAHHKLQAEIAADPIRYAQRSVKLLQAHVEIKTDPVRNASRSANLSKANAEIAADPIRNAQRSANMSKAAIKANAEIAADPIRNASRSVNLYKAQAKIAADPIRNTSRSTNMSRARAEIAADPIRNAQRSANLSAANSRAKNGYAKPILVGSKTYGCMEDAVDTLPFGKQKLRKLLKDPNNFNYQYIGKR